MAQLKKQVLYRYFEQWKLDKPGWWRFFLSVSVFFTIVLIISLPISITQVVFTINWSEVLARYSESESAGAGYLREQVTLLQSGVGINSVVESITNLLFIGSMLLALFLVVRTILGRPYMTLINPEKNFDWKKFWYGFRVFGAALLITTVLLYSYLFITGQPSRLRLTELPLEHWLLFALALIPLVFFQVAAEEVLFRGYIAQYAHRFGTWITGFFGIAQWIKPLPLTLAFALPTALFGIAHIGNGPFEAGLAIAFSYYLLGLFLQYVTYKDNSLEAAIGIHYVNNLIAFLVIGLALDGFPFSLVVDTSSQQQFNSVTGFLFGFLPIVLAWGWIQWGYSKPNSYNLVPQHRKASKVEKNKNTNTHS